MVALHRGRIAWPSWRDRMFEKAWDGDEEHLNPMAYSALYKINLFLEDQQQADHWNELFLESGGKNAVAKEWLEAIDRCLSAMGYLPTPISEE